MAPRNAFTLPELLIVLSIVAVLAAGAMIPFRAWLDAGAVRQAARETAAIFAAGRRAAIRHGAATVRIRATGVALEVRDSLVREYEFAGRLGVRVQTTTAAMTFGPAGLGRGIANGTIVFARRRAADTLVVSRLGRVRD